MRVESELATGGKSSWVSVLEDRGLIGADIPEVVSGVCAVGACVTGRAWRSSELSITSTVKDGLAQ